MGATVEIQRSQQAEALEQQLIRARNRFNVVRTLDSIPLLYVLLILWSWNVLN